MGSPRSSRVWPAWAHLPHSSQAPPPLLPPRRAPRRGLPAPGTTPRCCPAWARTPPCPPPVCTPSLCRTVHRWHCAGILFAVNCSVFCTLPQNGTIGAFPALTADAHTHAHAHAHAHAFAVLTLRTQPSGAQEVQAEMICCSVPPTLPRHRAVATRKPVAKPLKLSEVADASDMPARMMTDFHPDPTAGLHDEEAELWGQGVYGAPPPLPSALCPVPNKGFRGSHFWGKITTHCLAPLMQMSHCGVACAFLLCRVKESLEIRLQRSSWTMQTSDTMVFMSRSQIIFVGQ